MSQFDRVTQHPRIMGGNPVIKGTKVTVKLIFRMIGVGASEESVLWAYAHLKKEDIQAAARFAANALAHADVLLVP